jgi:hypothetical protein
LDYDNSIKDPHFHPSKLGSLSLSLSQLLSLSSVSVSSLTNPFPFFSLVSFPLCHLHPHPFFLPLAPCYPETFNPFLIRLLTFPLVTIAAINGHAFAGGFLVALACDFRLISAEDPAGKKKVWCCMNEVDFGAPFPVRSTVLAFFPFPPS